MIRIVFILRGEVYLQVKWPHVPRLGDHVDLQTVNPQETKVVRVIKVLWRHVGGEGTVDVTVQEV